MSKQTQTAKTRSAYDFIKAHCHEYGVWTMCRVLKVAPSGYYAWLQEPVSNRAQEDLRLLRLIRTSFTASHGLCGSPRIFLDLREAGETCSKHHVARLIRVNKIRALHGYRSHPYSTTKPSAFISNLPQLIRIASRNFVTGYLTDDVTCLPSCSAL